MSAPGRRWRDGARARVRPAPGFTLVEALVALVILAIVSVLAYRGTEALTSGEARLAAESERWRTLDAVFDRIEADLRAAIPRGSRHGAVREPAWWTRTEADGSSTLVFSRAGSEFSADPARAGQRVGYRLRRGVLEVLYWPEPDNVGERDPAAYALLPGVTRFRAEALAADGSWSTQWPLSAGDALPRGARVTLTLADGTAVERWFALQ